MKHGEEQVPSLITDNELVKPEIAAGSLVTAHQIREFSLRYANAEQDGNN